MVLKRLMFIFCIILFSSNVFAIGISPAKVNYDFERGLSDVVTFNVLNNEDRTMDVKVFLKGDLVEYFDFEEVEITLGPGANKTMTAAFTLPVGVDLMPGDRRTDIVAAEISESSSQVGAVAAVGLVILVRVPYEGQYLKTDFSAKNAEIGEKANITVAMESLGTDVVSSVNGKITIRDFKNNTIDAIDFQESGILPGETRRKSYDWNSGDNVAGKYNAVLDLSYVGKSQKLETGFRLGTLIIEILELDTYKIIKDRINRIQILTQSLWNDEIEDVYATMEIDGKITKSENFYYEGWGRGNITLYFDANDFSTGNYEAKTILFYENKTTEKIFEVQIANEGALNSYTLYGIIVVVVIAGLVFFIKKRKLFKSKDKLK